MSAADSTDPSRVELTEVEWEAARGQLPDWARATPLRREHMARVAALLESWAAELGVGETETLRWAAVGWLHDALRDADPSDLRRLVRAEERDLPGPILHGPAAASRLAGHVGHSTLQAIRYHTIGHPTLDTMGRALYLADFLEPDRDFLTEWRAELRSRMPGDLDRVLEEVVATRIRHLLERRKPIRPETAGFWSDLVNARSG
jgi:HD superfamily phosphohydrolase YqeK